MGSIATRAIDAVTAIKAAVAATEKAKEIGILSDRRPSTPDVRRGFDKGQDSPPTGDRTDRAATAAKWGRT